MRQTVIGVFDKYAAAQRAAQVLEATGLPRDHVHVTSSIDDDDDDFGGNITQRQSQGQGQDQSQGQGRSEGVIGHVRSFFADLFGPDDNKEVSHYAEAVRRGGAVVKVDIDEESELPQVRQALETAGAVDIDEQVESWRAQGWADDQDDEAGDTGLSERRGSALAEEEGVIPVVAEGLEVGKRVVSTGGVRVYAHTVERPVEESVQLRSETAELERRNVDRPATESELSSLQDRTIEVREMEERPVVQKTARVIEEVRVGKRVEERTETITDTVRNTEVEIERLDEPSLSARASTLDEDSSLRDHFSTHYASTGASYDEYAPAYEYGRSLRGDGRYQNRGWDDFETDARSGWESKHPGNAWERFKAAVRHGWESITS